MPRGRPKKSNVAKTEVAKAVQEGPKDLSLSMPKDTQGKDELED